MRKLSPLGILLGGIADVIATNIFEIPVVLVAAAQTHVGHLPKAEMARAIVTTMQSSPGLRTTGWLLGGLASVLAGYLAARIAKRGEVVNGALSSYLCIGLGVYSVMFTTSMLPLWQHVASVIGSPVLGAIGGYLRWRQAARPAKPALATATI